MSAPTSKPAPSPCTTSTARGGPPTSPSAKAASCARATSTPRSKSCVTSPKGPSTRYMWQTVERKARFIAQVMRGTPRRPRDRGHRRRPPCPTAKSKPSPPATRASWKKPKPTPRLTRLERAERAHDRNQHLLAATISKAGTDLPKLAAERHAVQEAITRRVDTSGDRFSMTINGSWIRARGDAAIALRNALTAAQRAGEDSYDKPVQVATIGGFDVIATPRRYLEPHLTLELGGVPRSSFTVNNDELRSARPLGIVVKLENRAADLERTRDRIQASEHDLAAEADRARSDYGQPFAHTQVLADARARSAELAIELAEQDHDRPPADTSTATPEPAEPAAPAVRPDSSATDNPPSKPLEVAPSGGWTAADRVQPVSRDTSSYLSAQRYPLGTQLTVHAVGADGPGRRLSHGVVVDHPTPHHVTVESPSGTKRVAPISHVSRDTVEPVDARGPVGASGPVAAQPAEPAQAAGENPAQRWAAVCDRVDARITADAHWPALAAQLERAAATGTDVAAILAQITADDALPGGYPARSLAYRVADVVPDLRSPIRMRPADPDLTPRPVTPTPTPPSITPNIYRRGPRR